MDMKLKSSVKNFGGSVYIRVPSGIVELLGLRDRNTDTCLVGIRAGKVNVEFVEEIE